MSDFPRDDLIRMVDLPTSRIELRAEEESTDGLGTLHGYAAVFNEDTVIDSWEGQFVERIAPGAFTKTLEERGDRVKVLFNHGFDPSIGDKPLGKAAGPGQVDLTGFIANPRLLTLQATYRLGEL